MNPTYRDSEGGPFGYEVVGVKAIGVTQEFESDFGAEQAADLLASWGWSSRPDLTMDSHAEKEGQRSMTRETLTIKSPRRLAQLHRTQPGHRPHRATLRVDLLRHAGGELGYARTRMMVSGAGERLALRQIPPVTTGSARQSWPSSFARSIGRNPNICHVAIPQAK